MRKLLISTIILISFYTYAKPELVLDYNYFLKEKDTYRTEVYLLTPVNRLKITNNQALFGYDIKVTDKNGKVFRDYWDQKFTIKDSTDLIKEIPDQTIFQLKPGSYKLQASLIDRNAKDTVFIDIPLKSGKFKLPEIYDYPVISGLQLGSAIDANPKKNSLFSKGNIDFIPNTRKLYGVHLPFIYYYAEIRDKNDGNKYNISWEIIDADDKVINSSKETKKVSSETKTNFLFGKIKVHNLVSGSYKLIIKAKDNDKELTTQNSFFMFRKGDFTEKKTKIENITDILEIMPDAKVNNELKLISIVESKKIKDTISKLNEIGKRSFLKKYWEEKEKHEPGARTAFLQRAKAAEIRYGMAKTKGAKTHMGKIFMLLGDPDKVDRVTMNPSMYNHEIWHYYRHNAIFVFADLHNLGYYRQIHSTYKDEIRNNDWESKVQKTKKSTINSRGTDNF